MVHPLHRRQLLHAGSLHSVQRLEGLPQRLPALRPYALHMVQHGHQIALAAQLAMEGDGKAMRLIANALNQMQRRAISIEQNARAPMRQKNLLLALGETHHG